MFLFDTASNFEIWHPFYAFYILWIVGMGLFLCLIPSPEARSLVLEGVKRRDPLTLAAGCLMIGSLLPVCYAPLAVATLPIVLVGMGMPWQGVVVLYSFGIFWLVIVSRFYEHKEPTRMT